MKRQNIWEHTIIAAFDNFGGLSYPALFKSVIGVSGSDFCIANSDIEYIKNPMVNVCGKSNKQSVISSSGRIIMREGNSLACAHVTGVLSDFYSKEMGLQDALKQLEMRAACTRNMPYKKANMIALPQKCKRAALVTFGKEMHSIIRFRNMLSFEIVKIYDAKQMGTVGKYVNKELNIDDNKELVMCLQ